MFLTSSSVINPNRSLTQLTHTLILAFLIVSCSCQFTNPGCNSFDADNKCIGCKERYFLELGVCYPVSPLCLTYDSSTGACLSCYENYQLEQARCVRKPIPNCMTYTPLGDCQQCQDRYFLEQSTCKQISKGCNNYLSNGTCTSCFEDYILSSQQCIAKIQNCLTQSGQQCQQCKTSYILFENICNEMVQNCINYHEGKCLQCNQSMILVDQLCLPLIDNCTEYNISSGYCLTCQPYFQIFQGQCMPIMDPFCTEFQGTVCKKCSKNYYFGQDQRCIQVNPLCRTYNQNDGQCLSCFNGYLLQNGICKEAPKEMDPYCNYFNGTKCLRCSWGYRFNTQGICVQLDYLCRLYNPTTYQCQQCYPGFMVGEDQRCGPITQPGCLTWFNRSCQSCYSGYYLALGKCQSIDPLCSRFDLTTLKCLTCYSGYEILDGKCQLIKQDSTSWNCRQTGINGQCLSCYFGAYISQGKCINADPLCKTFDPKDGKCLSCYGGYFLMKRSGKCVPFH